MTRICKLALTASLQVLIFLTGQAYICNNLSYQPVLATDSVAIENILTAAEDLFAHNPDAAIRQIDSAIILAVNSSQWALQGRSEELAGKLLTQTGEFISALPRLENARDLYLEHNLVSDAARLKIIIGNVHLDLGKYEVAMDQFIGAAELAEEAGDVLMLAYSYRSISFLYNQQNAPEKSLENIQRAIKVLESTDYDSADLVEMWQTKAIALNKNGLTDSSIYYYLTSADYNRRHNVFSSLAGNLNNLARIYEKRGDLQAALKIYKECLSIDEENNDRYGLTYSHIGCANVYRQLGKPDSALYHALLSYRIASELQADQRILKAAESLTDIYKSLEIYDSALFYAEINAAVKDSLFESEKVRMAFELDQQYDTRQKEDEILLLTQQKDAAAFRRNTYLAIGSLVIGILGLLYYQQRRKVIFNSKLLQSEQETDRLKSRFITNISHEFRTPLTLILGPLEDLITNVSLPELRQKFRLMHTNARRLLHLVNQLLDLAKLESGKMPLIIEEDDIVSFVMRVMDSFQALAEKKNISLVLDHQFDEFSLNFDHSKVETILVNLLSNALKFTPDHGHVHVTLKFPEISTDQPLVISVADSGPGIPENEIEQIFNRFYQSDFKNSQGSGGIGLSLVRELVELHKGEIRVRSEAGGGTEFLVALPTDLPVSEEVFDLELSSVGVAAEDVLRAGIEADEIPGMQGELPLVLVVEDNPEIRMYIGDTLKDSFRVISASNGNEGIEVARKILPDLIISDIMMPEKDGKELCSSIKSHDLTCHIPVVLLTAKSGLDDKIEGLEARADDYITKPFVPRELLVRANNLIESRVLLREKYQETGILDPKKVTVNSLDESFLQRMVNIVEEHIANEKFGVEQLGDLLSMSRSQLHRKLTALLGHGPNQFIRNFRLQRAHALLEKQSATISEIAYQVGFSSPSYFTKCFHDRYGFSPSEI